MVLCLTCFDFAHAGLEVTVSQSHSLAKLEPSQAVRVFLQNLSGGYCFHCGDRGLGAVLLGARVACWLLRDRWRGGFRCLGRTGILIHAREQGGGELVVLGIPEEKVVIDPLVLKKIVVDLV